MQKICAGLGLACTVAWTLSAAAGIKWYAVDPMGEEPYMPDKAPAGGKEGAPLRMIAARGEYEPCSFVLVADQDLGKVRIELGNLKSEKGNVFPQSKLDLKTVKVWYQAGNAWISYFGDPSLKLCPELLLNDEDLVKVDAKAVANYARLTEKDGSVRYRWLNPPYQVPQTSFRCMAPNFSDAATHQGVALKKGEYKQLFITAEIGRDVKPGLYKGEVKVQGPRSKVQGLRSKVQGAESQVSANSETQELRNLETSKLRNFETSKLRNFETICSIPIALRVLDFELPDPKCYNDVKKDYTTWFCESVGLAHVMKLNGNDRALAERQLVKILRDFVRHGETLPSYQDAVGDGARYGIEAGMNFSDHLGVGLTLLGEPAEMRYDARHRKADLDRRFGPGEKIITWGDEFGISKLRGIRHMVKIYQDAGFRFSINSWMGYEAAGHLSDIWWPSLFPGKQSTHDAQKYNDLGGDGRLGWYAQQHVGVENPAFARRQYGIGPYRAGFSCNFNYEQALCGWNDFSDFYRPMQLVYGCGSGCVDTIAWEGFREGLDDIRYATLLRQLALPMSQSADTDRRYVAKKALMLLADADGDDMDLTTLRLEMIGWIEKMLKL